VAYVMENEYDASLTSTNEELRVIVRRLEVGHNLSADDCGKISRCIIVAWIYLVDGLVWDPSGEDGTEAEDEKSGQARSPVSMADLPDIAAWS